MAQVFERVSNIDLHLQEGYQEIQLKDCEQMDVVLHVDKRRRAQLFFTYDGLARTMNISVYLAQDAVLEAVFYNRVQKTMHITQTIIAAKDAKAHIGYGDFQNSESIYDIQVEMPQSGSEITLTSTVIANVKHFHVEMHHQVPNTHGEMHHYAIVEEAGDYRMNASGIIDKGANASACHQTTRVLTMSEHQKSEVEPVLLIDENDVKASHATTLGQIDDAQLYYLQSRGLNRAQALGLLTIGYVLPICDVVKHEELRQFLQKEIEEKVIRHV